MKSGQVLIGMGLSVALFWFGAAGVPAGEEKRVTTMLEQRYNRVRTLQAHFIQRYTLGRITRIESGTVYFQKPGKMRWEYDSPQEKLFLSDGTYVYLYVPSEQHLSRSRLRDTADWRVPFGLLFGRIEFGELFSRLETKSTERPGQASLTQLRGLPKSARQGFSEIWLDVNSRGQLERIEIRQPDGVVMEFHFRDWRENHALAPELFRLQTPPGMVSLDTPEHL